MEGEVGVGDMGGNDILQGAWHLPMVPPPTEIVQALVAPRGDGYYIGLCGLDDGAETIHCLGIEKKTVAVAMRHSLHETLGSMMLGREHTIEVEKYDHGRRCIERGAVDSLIR